MSYCPFVVPISRDPYAADLAGQPACRNLYEADRRPPKLRLSRMLKAK